MVDAVIVKRFEDVIAKGETALRQFVSQPSLHKVVEPEKFFEWQTQSSDLLRTVFGDNSSFTATFEKRTENTFAASVEAGVGILKSALENFSHGFTCSLKERVHAEVFDDYLEMATSLFGDGYNDDAAVIAGSTLEAHLRSLCQKNGIDTTVTKPNGSVEPKKASAMNDDLRIFPLYNQIEWRSVQSWLDLRNDAAHGNYGNYKPEQVGLMIDGIRDFMVRHPA
ncbi:MAG: hypothetical protein ACJ789_05530 [Thermomicrobiales bacterium]